MGVNFIASGFSSKVRDLASLIQQGMDYPGFSIVHVQSPCTTYNDNYDLLKGNVKKEIAPIAWDIPEDHDTSDKAAAYSLLQEGGIPLGLVYQREDSDPMDKRVELMAQKARPRSLEDQVEAFAI